MRKGFQVVCTRESIPGDLLQELLPAGVPCRGRREQLHLPGGDPCSQVVCRGALPTQPRRAPLASARALGRAPRPGDNLVTAQQGRAVFLLS